MNVWPIKKSWSHCHPNIHFEMCESHRTTTWLDHLVCTNSAHSLVENMHIKYGCITSDHHPVITNISMKDVQLQDVPTRMQDTIKWDKLTAEEILQYKLRSEKERFQVLLDHGVILCDNPQCLTMALFCVTIHSAWPWCYSVWQSTLHRCGSSQCNWSHVPVNC